VVNERVDGDFHVSDTLTNDSLRETAEQILRRRADSLALEAEDSESAALTPLLLFRMGDEWYCVRVSDVREIYQEYRITSIPCVPDHLLGVVNIRGEILSVTDLARMMGLGEVDMAQPVQPPALVLQNDQASTAIVVDEIGDIAEVAHDAIEPPISIIDRGQAEFISGSVHLEETMIGLLNVERVLEPIGATARHS
jgi:purine-binding chemotaxis protein CheW